MFLKWLRVRKGLGLSPDEFLQVLREKRGWHWVLTSFGLEVWGKTEEDKSMMKTS